MAEAAEGHPLRAQLAEEVAGLRREAVAVEAVEEARPMRWEAAEAALRERLAEAEEAEQRRRVVEVEEAAAAAPSREVAAPSVVVEGRAAAADSSRVAAVLLAVAAAWR